MLVCRQHMQLLAASWAGSGSLYLFPEVGRKSVQKPTRPSRFPPGCGAVRWHHTYYLHYPHREGDCGERGGTCESTSGLWLAVAVHISLIVILMEQT